MSDYTEIRYDVDGPVATVTLHRPEKLNAFTVTMRRQIISALDEAEDDDAVRAIVVTGEGRAFCAGADLSGPGTPQVDQARPTDEEVAGVPRDDGGILSLRIASARKPVIGAVNGAAVGVGATMLLPMDIRIASDTARFGFVFARRGIVPEAASSWFLPRVVGISQACEWALSGRLFDADEALRGRLVSSVVPAGRLLERAREIALEIAVNTSAVAVAATRQLLWSSLSASSPWSAHVAETLVIRQLKEGGDPAEGGRSFLEKRAPSFPMRLSTDYPRSAPTWPQRPDDLDAIAQAATAGPEPDLTA